MSRTVTAFFDSRSEAEAARDRLSQSSIDAGRVRIVDQNEAGSGSSGGEGEGFWSSLKSTFLPEEDSHAYEEGMRRGGYLVCAEVDESQADSAVSILEQSGSVDFEQRQSEWRQEGWTGYAGAGATGLAGSGATARHDTDSAVAEERLPIVEEEMRIGKREVERGGARVHSYVRETPVHEQVSLREEHVSVERRPVDRPLERGALDRDGDLLRERSVEMTETAEEAVVGKEARVREELVLRKTAEQRTEQIDDTVRHTEVEVDESGAGNRSAFGSFGGERRVDGQGSPLGSGEGREREREDGGFQSRE